MQTESYLQGTRICEYIAILVHKKLADLNYNIIATETFYCFTIISNVASSISIVVKSIMDIL